MSWKVQRVTTGEREFFRAVKVYGNNVVSKGGIWKTEAEAAKVAKNLNDTESITDSVFEGADSVERIERNIDEIVDFYLGLDKEEVFIDDEIDEF